MIVISLANATVPPPAAPPRIWPRALDSAIARFGVHCVIANARPMSPKTSGVRHVVCHIEWSITDIICRNFDTAHYVVFLCGHYVQVKKAYYAMLCTLCAFVECLLVCHAKLRFDSTANFEQLSFWLYSTALRDRKLVVDCFGLCRLHEICLHCLVKNAGLIRSH